MDIIFLKRGAVIPPALCPLDWPSESTPLNEYGWEIFLFLILSSSIWGLRAQRSIKLEVSSLAFIEQKSRLPRSLRPSSAEADLVQWQESLESFLGDGLFSDRGQENSLRGERNESVWEKGIACGLSWGEGCFCGDWIGGVCFEGVVLKEFVVVLPALVEVVMAVMWFAMLLVVVTLFL